MDSGVYRIKCKENGKCYIGSSKRLHSRKLEHFNFLRSQKHHSKILQNAFNKYGEEQFVFDVIEYCEKDLEVREQHYINTENSDYNVLKFAGRGLGYKHSLEDRQKIIEGMLKSDFIYISLDNEALEFVRLYKAGKSASEIAKQYNTSVPRVLRRLKKAKVKLRTAREVAISTCTKAIELDELTSNLINKYKEGKTMNYLAKKYNTNTNFIKRRLVKFNVEIRSHYESTCIGVNEKRLNNNIKTL